MFSAADTLAMQQAQYRHDKLNHCDIANLHKGERLKHYGLHFCKYVGRLARGRSETKPIERTVVDTTLVCLSAANTLSQRLANPSHSRAYFSSDAESILFFADAAGRFADACEKFDHLEDCVAQARVANSDIFDWLGNFAESRQIDILEGIKLRREELRVRAFYASE